MRQLGNNDASEGGTVLTSFRPQTTISLLFHEAEVPGARDLLEGAVPFDPHETRYDFSPAYAGVSRCLPAKSLSQSPGGRGTWRII